MQRQPFGGWKKSAVGAGTKAGGPNYLVGLGEWVSKPSTAAGAPARSPTRASAGSSRRPQGFLAAGELESLQRALASDALAWAEEFGTAKDVSGLSAERNIFRYRALPVTVRLSDGEPLAGLVRTVAAGVLAGLGADGVHRRRTPRPAAHRALRPWHRRHRGERRRLAGLRRQARRRGQARPAPGSG